MAIYKSSEDYLETILILKERIGEVRSIDIVNETGYKKSSISVAMKKLKEDNYIEMDCNGYISLTNKGYVVASDIYNKHEYLRRFFISLGVSENTAESDACKIEHEISDETFECIKKYFKNELIK
ncbi:iron (metal) dependent repressor, DtxR family [Hathewaya proteolytica DSM 3090]|uniref:Iron (Metal) dependent repressor, DtxR family n=1 Tax=Hathewaya proteolytica DSM 3090 TaxID=1121331 RepID=A0A1M6PU50_9CLOT|nr:metal-dependent transcriptional regulator [Hathewaya proteolytica]SHK11483.1 iron (metal) dependent repressor, DtxR family [Hathewaya proteolytica DSM 3090]